MTERILFPEFRGRFEHTRYPFADSATLKTSDGTMTIESDTFLDAAIYPIGGGARIFLSSILVTSKEIRLGISDIRQQELASVTFDPLDPPDILRLTDTWDRPAGILVSRRSTVSRFNAWGSQT